MIKPRDVARTAVAVCALTLNANLAQASLFYYDGFADAPGTDTPAGWSDQEYGDDDNGHYTLGIGISAGSLSYPSFHEAATLLSTGNKWELGVNSASGSGSPATPLGDAMTVFGDPVATGETIYFSFLLQVTDLGKLTSGTSSVISLRTESSGDSEVVAGIGFGRPSGEDGYKLSFHGRHRGYSHQDSIVTDDLFGVGETLLIVGAYARAGGDSTVSFWVNPDPMALGSSTAPDADYEFALTSTQALSVDRLHIKPQQTSTNAIPGRLYFDELRFGETWADVTPVQGPQLVKVDTAPVIDGEMDQLWFASAPRQIAKLSGGVTPDNAQDFSARWFGLYDDDNFYLAIDIKDEVLTNDASPEDWQNDRIEVYLNMDNVKPAGNARTGDNYQYVFVWDGIASVSGDGSLDGVVWKQQDTDDGCFIEIAFPWDTLFLNTPGGVVQEGYEFGFDVSIIDNDGNSTYDSIMSWHTPTGGLWSNMDSAGTVSMGGAFDGNYPPAIEPIDAVQYANEGEASSFVVTASDANEEDTLSFALSGAPDFISITDNADRTASINIDAAPGDANIYSFTVSVSDGRKSGVTDVLLIVKDPAIENQVPVFEAVDTVAVDQNESVTIELFVTDLDSLSVSIALADGAPGWAAVEDHADKSASLLLSPSYATEPGNYTITVEATDSEGATGSIDVAVEVVKVVVPDWWPSYKEISETAVNTGQFLGEVWHDEAPWFLQVETGIWFYADPLGIEPGIGGWIFTLDLLDGALGSGSNTWAGFEIYDDWVWTGMGWLYIAAAPYVYCIELNTWVYAQEALILAGAPWLYVFDGNQGGSLPDPAEIEASWQEAWDSNDQELIDRWYEANTGPGAIGVFSHDMLPVGDVEITEAWLTATAGPHVFQEKGRWVVNAIHASSVNIQADNVTLRGSLIDMNSPSTTFGISGNGNGTIIEYCELTNIHPDSPQSSKGIASISNYTVRHTEVHGVAFTAIRLSDNSTGMYNYVHSGVIGIKHVSMAIRGNNTYAYRNNLQTNSGSATLGIYSHDVMAPPTGFDNVLVEENLLNATNGHYAMMAGGTWNSQTQQATNIVVINNKFGVKYHPSSGWTGSNYLWLGRAPEGQCVDDRGNTWYGNRWLTSGNYVRPRHNNSTDNPSTVYNDPCADGPR